MAQDCGDQVMVYSPGQGGRTISLGDLQGRLAGSGTVDPTDPNSPDGETWREVGRQTSTVTVSGVTIERIDSVDMERPSGAVIRLVFNNS